MDAIWQMSSEEAENYPTLTQNRSVEVAVIGGGITGLTTAMQLAEAGLKVVILEALTVGKGGTGGSTGNLYSPLATGLAPLRKKWGDETIRDVVDSRSQAINHIEFLVNHFAIDCQFHRCPMYRIVTGEDKKAIKALDAEREAMRCAGLVVSSTEDSILPFPKDHGLKVENQAQFNPLSYVQGLANTISQKGVEIYENSPVREVNYKQGIIKTDSAQVTAKHIVHATHTPKGVSLLHTELRPSREYAVSAKINNDTYPDGIFFVHDPFHSIRSYQQGNERYLMAIGEEHPTGEGEPNDTHYERLRDYLATHFDVASFHNQWSNQQYIPADSLPYIGKVHGQDNAYLATGFSADGLIWGTLAGLIISDLILGRDNPWHKRFDSRRFTPGKSAMKWTEANASVIKHLVTDYLSVSKLNEFDDITPGEGKIVKHEGEKLAIYRNEAGELSVLSAVCPHMKCLVHWNRAETSWDCPCHGSRFDTQGEVIEGPSFYPLVRRSRP